MQSARVFRGGKKGFRHMARNPTSDQHEHDALPAGMMHSPAFALPATPAPALPRREKFIGFVRDEASASLLHEVLAAAFPDGNHFHIVDFRASLAILGGMTTPEIVLVDVSGEDQPINAMMDLAEVVEPGTMVLVIGETTAVNFYRTATKGMGVREYLAKPLTRASVERNFLSVLSEQSVDDAPRGGRMVAVAGARGGIGTSTVATNLAWMIGVEMHRHTVLLDSDLHSGTTALALDVKHSSGLCTALESPHRIDQLLIERATQTAGERLHVLAAVEPYNRMIEYESAGATHLAQALRARYNFVIADAGAKLGVFARDLLYQAHQKVLVVDPSLISVRNLERLLGMSSGPLQSPKVMLVLNLAGRPGGLSQSYMEQTLGIKFDTVIPDLPRILPKASQFGQPAVTLRGPFRNAISKLATALGANAIAEVVGADRAHA
jgi:pilus assembly protein CpaE